MPACVSSSRTFGAFAAFAAAVVLAGAAQAGDGSVRPSNFRFGDGSKGFALSSQGGPINPGILVGFNPQPDPPGDVGFALIDLTDPFHPSVHAPLIEGANGYRFQFFHNLDLGDGSVTPIDAPNAEGFTGFRQVFNDHIIDVAFHFGPGQVDRASWVGFNPQPDPPGFGGFGEDFNFLVPSVHGVTALDRGGADTRPNAVVTFSVAVDGDLLSFSATPEPATWAMMILGFGGTGILLRRRRRDLATA